MIESLIALGVGAIMMVGGGMLIDKRHGALAFVGGLLLLFGVMILFVGVVNVIGSFPT